MGGKIGIGDNCLQIFSVGGYVCSLKVLNCIVIFVFYIGLWYFGIFIVYVDGSELSQFKFILVLLVQVFKGMVLFFRDYFDLCIVICCQVLLLL